MRRPGLTFMNCFANGRKCLIEKNFLLRWHGLLAQGLSAWRPMPQTGSRELASARSLLPMLKSYFFMAGFCANLA